MTNVLSSRGSPRICVPFPRGWSAAWAGGDERARPARQGLRGSRSRIAGTDPPGAGAFIPHTAGTE